MTPDYITELKLGFAFRGHQPPFVDCVKSSRLSELIIDTSTGISEFSFDKNHDSGFEIINISSKLFSMIQIDGKLIRNSAGGQCDCCVIDERYMLFVELKTNAHSTNYALEHYEKASKQIGHTIEIFKGKCQAIGVYLEAKKEIEAHVCFNNLFPRTNATEQNESVKFSQRYLIPLYFDNKKNL